MTNQRNATIQAPVYFGFNWGEDAMPAPADSIRYATQVLRAMNDLLAGYRDPNELGENPDGDTRCGINFVFEACAMQLDNARAQIDAVDDAPRSLGAAYPRFETGAQELDLQADITSKISWDEWQSPSQWAAQGLQSLPSTQQGIHVMAVREDWKSDSQKARERKKPGGGWEYHISALPKEARDDFERRKAFFQTAYNDPQGPYEVSGIGGSFAVQRWR